MRLDWYLPVIRKPKPDDPPPKRSWIVRVAKRILPTSLFSNWDTKQRGLGRKFLRKFGISWLSSPVRRVCQATCLILFLLFFFYVCWPYSATPAQSWSGWIPVEIDDTTGAATVVSEEERVIPFAPGMRLFAAESFPGEEKLDLLGEFRIESVMKENVRLTPVEQLSDDRLAAVLLSAGPWVLSESDPTGWPSHYADNLAEKEVVHAELFLIIDPLVSLSTGIASRSWVWSLASAGIILTVCILIPRGFCGYLCPLGTTIDLFDWSIANRVKRFRVSGNGWWVHIKYYLLLAVLIAAVCGVLLSGFVAAIPVITRGLLFTLSPFQTGYANGWHQVPPMHWGHLLSLILFFMVLCLGFLQPRFWCKYVCPSGAVFSLGNLFRASERKVESSCINCNKCVEICPFDAIKPDFTTRTADCTLCQSCAGVCPTHAIKFVGRWEVHGLKQENDPPTHETPLGRRGFLATTTGVVAGACSGIGIAAGTKAFGANHDDPDSLKPVRPPGSVPEREFLQMCIRCGECYQSCPSDVLQPEGFEQGLEGLWAPMVKADWAGCASSCNACGQVCPTGAIRALTIEEKSNARMGLAFVNEETCLPFAGREACQLCVDECHSAGYHAIEFTQVHTEVDELGIPVEGTGYLAPVVVDDKCVGCGLCQTRCYGINKAEKGLLDKSAIVIKAGTGHEDRMMSGSYIELRQQEQKNKQQKTGGDFFLPDLIKEN